MQQKMHSQKYYATNVIQKLRTRRNLKGCQRVWPCRRPGSSCECCDHLDCEVLSTFHSASKYHCKSKHNTSSADRYAAHSKQHGTHRHCLGE